MNDFVTTNTENPSISRLRDRIARSWDGLSRAERAVCRVLSSTSAERLLYASAADLGEMSKTSNASVVRTLQTLGYSGLSELKQEIAAPLTSQVAPDVRLRQRIEHLGRDIDRVQQEIWSEAQALIEHARTLNADATLSSAVNLLVHARTVSCYGLGASKVAAEHLAVRLGRTGLTTRHLSADGFMLADELLHLGAGDAVVVFAPGRMTRDIEAILEQAHLVGAQVILVTDHLHERLSQPVDVVIQAPHTPTGLTSESLTGLLVGDILVQGITVVGPDAALQSSHTLNDIRSRLGY
ncbi:MurR/RpiR family transcriptional regulator [Leucobacter zeae]|nr:MurR/RpiR family transcriptional regulator [Leucobacter zeae]